MTVNRVCGSGAQAIVTAAQAIWLDQDQVAVAGGMENMDRAPYLMDGGRWGYRMGPAEIHDSMLRDGLDDAFSGKHSGWHTEDLVIKAQISREAQDRWAERSQRRFAEAQKAGRFKDEGLNSAASAMLVASRAFVEANGIVPMARLVAFGVAAVEPGMFGLGPIPAVRRALERAGWQMGDIERIEINEAFAAIPIAVAHELGLPEDIINVEGGAIAHGHPIGATGAILTTRLLHSMRRDGLRRGIVTLCIGGGQGIALALERI
jgi:acetyl-CoA C-acetyltransferase